MKKKTLNNGEMLDASLEATLAVELFLNENYLFHRNVQCAERKGGVCN